MHTYIYIYIHVGNLALSTSGMPIVFRILALRAEGHSIGYDKSKPVFFMHRMHLLKLWRSGSVLG